MRVSRRVCVTEKDATHTLADLGKGPNSPNSPNSIDFIDYFSEQNNEQNRTEGIFGEDTHTPIVPGAEPCLAMPADPRTRAVLRDGSAGCTIPW